MFAIFKAIQKVKADRRQAQRALEKSYRELEAQLAYQDALDERSRRAFTYGDMQDIVKTASRGITVDIKFLDGTVVKLKSEDPLQQYQDALRVKGEYF